MVFVTEEEARTYFLPPNSQVLLMDKNSPKFYIKSTDASGQVQQFDTYKFEKVTPVPPVTQSDLAAFRDEILSLLKQNKEVPQEDVKPDIQPAANW